MEQKLKNAFNALVMPESCARHIEEKLCKPSKKGYYAEPVQPGKGGWQKGIAAAAALICVVAVGTLLLPDFPMDSRLETENPTDGYSDIPEETLGFDHYFTVDEKGRVYCRDEHVAQSHAASAPEWIKDEDGRLCFTGNGEKIDITNLISLEEPYMYTYPDSDGVVQCLVVGRTTSGPYVDIGNSVGWFTFRWDDSLNCWIRDGGTHWSNWMHCEWPWLTQAQETLKYEDQLDELNEELEYLRDSVERTRDTHPENHHDDHCH